jgi:hypothetical protein
MEEAVEPVLVADVDGVDVAVLGECVWGSGLCQQRAVWRW